MKAYSFLAVGSIILCAFCYGADPEDEIIGTWEHTEDSSIVVEFTEDGLKRTYYEGEMNNEYDYELVEECKGVTALDQSPLETVLQVTVSTEQDNCYHVMNLTNERLTLAPFEVGGFSTYERVE